MYLLTKFLDTKEAIVRIEGWVKRAEKWSQRVRGESTPFVISSGVSLASITYKWDSYLSFGIDGLSSSHLFGSRKKCIFVFGVWKGMFFIGFPLLGTISDTAQRLKKSLGPLIGGSPRTKPENLADVILVLANC